MNRNIILTSLLIAIFFMALSLMLRMLFFTTYFSLIKQPLIVFTIWFGVIAFILFFLKNDFPEIYKQLVFFKDKEKPPQPDDKENLEKLDLLDDSDYSDVFVNNTQQAKEDNSPSNQNHHNPEKMADKSQSHFIHQTSPTQKVRSYHNTFEKEDPKKLAGLIKNYLNKD